MFSLAEGGGKLEAVAAGFQTVAKPLARVGHTATFPFSVICLRDVVQVTGDLLSVPSRPPWPLAEHAPSLPVSMAFHETFTERACSRGDRLGVGGQQRGPQDASPRV